MTDLLGIVVHLKSGLWVDESLAGRTFTFSRDDFEIRIALPEISTGDFLGFRDLVGPKTIFPPDYKWSDESNFSSHYWGYMSNHHRDEHQVVVSATFCIQRFVVTTTTVPESCENLPSYLEKFEGVWEAFWNQLRISIEVLSCQDVENGSNLDSASKESYYHQFQSDKGTAGAHLVSRFGVRPLIQARPITFTEYNECFKAAVDHVSPDVSQLMLREARLKYNNLEYKLCLIHSATALEIKLMEKIRTIDLPRKYTEDEKFNLDKKTLGTLVEIWNAAVESGFQAKVGNLVGVRNYVVHHGGSANEEQAMKMYQLAEAF
jgi:hypothetical protein